MDRITERFTCRPRLAPAKTTDWPLITALGAITIASLVFILFCVLKMGGVL